MSFESEDHILVITVKVCLQSVIKRLKKIQATTEAV